MTSSSSSNYTVRKPLLKLLIIALQSNFISARRKDNSYQTRRAIKVIANRTLNNPIDNAKIKEALPIPPIIPVFTSGTTVWQNLYHFENCIGAPDVMYQLKPDLQFPYELATFHEGVSINTCGASLRPSILSDRCCVTNLDNKPEDFSSSSYYSVARNQPMVPLAVFTGIFINVYFRTTKLLCFVEYRSASI